jgi:hypothetical protein
MLKPILAASLLSLAAVASSNDATAEHRWQNNCSQQSYNQAYHQPRYRAVKRQRSYVVWDDEEDGFYHDDDIVVPRRSNKRGWVDVSTGDDESHDFNTYEERFNSDDNWEEAEIEVPRRKLTVREKRRIAAITGKLTVKTPVFDEFDDQEAEIIAPKKVPPKKQVKIASLEPQVKLPVVKKTTVVPKVVATEEVEPVKVAPKKTPEVVVPKIVVPKVQQQASLPKNVPATDVTATVKPKTVPKLTLAPEDLPVTEPKKGALQTKLPEAQPAISCDKAGGIVAGFGFSKVQPQMCVGKTYSFKATCDGTQFEVSISATSGELTEVKRL